MYGAYAGRLAETGVYTDDIRVVVGFMNGRERFFQVHGVNGLVQSAIEMEHGAVISGQGCTYQRTQAVSGRTVCADADNDNRTALDPRGEMVEQTMYNSGMDFGIGMWYF
ncbi:hypothetical protein XI25_07185 [Paenibacillus sp. DMB20]|nr:hypothetical protein XI25_07185 [Paenibacillus sp. DMB20]